MHLKRIPWLICLMLLLPLFSLNAQDGATAQAYRTVNVRQGPGTQYDIIGQLTNGDITLITGRSDEESNWLRINFDGGEGWVAFFTVSVTGNLDISPIIDVERVSEGAIGEVETSSAFVSEVQYADEPYVVAFRRVNVRVGPGTNFARIGYMNPGNAADLWGRTEDNEWLEINFDGQSGWVAFFVVSVNGELEDIPVVQVSEAAQPTTVPPRTTTNTPVIQVTTRFNSNLRVSPEFSSEIITIIPYNILLIAEERTDDSDWLKVIYEGESGWLITSLVQIRTSTSSTRRAIESLPVAQN